MKSKRVFTAIAIALFTVIFVIIKANKTEENSTGKNDNEYKEILYSDDVTKVSNFSFAGENIPLNRWYVKERLDRELLVNSYWHSSTILILKRTSKYFPIIEPILSKNNIPNDFKYLCVIESSLSNVKSPAGAMGFWQFMKGTARDYGLTVNNQIDERRHLVKSTEAACKYLNDMYKRFGNWTLVAASYNVGYTGLKKRLNKQKEKNYYNLVLPEETQRYMYRILAFKKIIQSPEKFKFNIINKYNFPKYKEIIITKSIDNLVNFAKKNSISYHELVTLNPWIRGYQLPVVGKKKYILKIPVYDTI